jgi:hypothetical protein
MVNMARMLTVKIAQAEQVETAVLAALVELAA